MRIENTHPKYYVNQINVFTVSRNTKIEHTNVTCDNPYNFMMRRIITSYSGSFQTQGVIDGVMVGRDFSCFVVSQQRDMLCQTRIFTENPNKIHVGCTNLLP